MMPRRPIVAALAALAVGAALVSGTPRPAVSDTSTLKYRAVAPLVSRDVAESTPTPPPDSSPPPTTGPSSYDLINQALEKSEITAEQAAIYRVFASFADPRLPAAFRGNDEDLHDSPLLYADGFGSLSQSAQEILRPFTLRPENPESWYYTTDAAPPQSQGASLAGDDPTASEVAAAARPPGPWLSVTGPKVRVLYPPHDPRREVSLAPRAAEVLNEAEKVIWPELVKLLGQEPPPDCLFICADFGGNNRYDIYLLYVPRSMVTGLCKGDGPSFMQLNPNSDFGTLSHELMHAFQFSFAMGGSGACNEYHWLQEATAQWAIDYVYGKKFNTDEQAPAPWYLNDPRLSLELQDDKHEYGAYLFFFYLTRISFAPEVIRDIWKAAGSNSDSLKAVDGAIPGGFKTQFH